MKYVLAGTVEGCLVRLTLQPGPNPINRAFFRQANLRAPSVSREHAELLVEANRMELRDLGSSNGTWVNGQRIHEPVQISTGDRLRFGDLDLALSPEHLPTPDTPPPRPEVSPSGTVLARPDEVSAREKLSWEELDSALIPDSVVDQALFRAVTEAGQILVVPRPLEEMFDQVLGLVERVVPARRILLLLSDSPEAEPEIRAARPPMATGDEKLILSRTIVRTVLQERQALLLDDTQSDPRFRDQESVVLMNLRSAMVAPLFDNTQVIGLLYADTDDPRVHYERNQLRAFSLLANLIAVKITNSRLLEAQREKERMEQELALAASVQRHLLPDSLPEIPGYEAVARQMPCFEVAGDLYDVARLDDGRFAIVVGDVTGKGVGAALLMSNVMASLRMLYQENADPAALVDRLHQHVLRSSDEIHFVTLFLGLLDPRAHRIEYVNAGHNPPFLLCAEGEPKNLAATGMPVGLVPGSTYTAANADLPPGALLSIFSDGIPEAMVEEEFFGEDRFLQSIQLRGGRPLDEIADGLFADMEAFLGDHPAGDDATLLLIRRRV